MALADNDDAMSDPYFSVFCLEGNMHIITMVIGAGALNIKPEISVITQR